MEHLSKDDSTNPKFAGPSKHEFLVKKTSGTKTKKKYKNTNFRCFDKASGKTKFLSERGKKMLFRQKYEREGKKQLGGATKTVRRCNK